MVCKFVRDVERFNEWGVKADFAVMKYRWKVNCLRSQDEVGEEAKTKQCGGGGEGWDEPPRHSHLPARAEG